MLSQMLPERVVWSRDIRAVGCKFHEAEECGNWAAVGAAEFQTKSGLRTCTEITFTNSLGQGSEAPLTQTTKRCRGASSLKSILSGKMQHDRNGGPAQSGIESLNSISISTAIAIMSL